MKMNIVIWAKDHKMKFRKIKCCEQPTWKIKHIYICQHENNYESRIKE